MLKLANLFGKFISLANALEHHEEHTFSSSPVVHKKTPPLCDLA